MRRGYGFLITLLAAVATVGLSAQSLEQLVDAALSRDSELDRLELSRSQLDLQYTLEDLGPPLALSLGTGSNGLSLQTNGGADGPAAAASAAPAWRYSLHPFAEITLSGDHTIRTTGSVSGSADEAPGLRSVGLSYGWNAGALGDTRADRVTMATRDDARADADRRLADRTFAVRRTVTERARLLIESEAAITEAQRAVDDAEAAIAQAQALGSAAAQSAAGEELRIGLARARRLLERRLLEHDEAIRDLEQLTGVRIAQAPALASGDPVSPAEDPAATREYAGAFRDADLARLRYGSDSDDPVTLALDAEYGYTPEDDAGAGPAIPALHTVGGGASIGIGDWTLTLGSRVRVSQDPDRVPVASTTSLGLTWTLPNARRDELEGAIDQIDLSRALLTFEATVDAIRDELELLQAQRRSLSERSLQLEESRLLAELRLLEAERRLELGLTSTDTVDDRREALEDIAFEQQLLAYDRELFRLSVLALTGESE